MNDQRAVEAMAKALTAPSDGLPKVESVLAALRAEGFDLYRPDALDRDLKWQCQGRVWPAGKPSDPSEHRAEEGHRGCKWVRLVPVGGEG